MKIFILILIEEIEIVPENIMKLVISGTLRLLW